MEKCPISHTVRSQISGRHEGEFVDEKLMVYFLRSRVKFVEQGILKNRYTVTEIVDITMCVVDLVGGGVGKPVIILVFVDGCLWRQRKMSDIEDPVKQVPESSDSSVELEDEEGPFDEGCNFVVS